MLKYYINECKLTKQSDNINDFMMNVIANQFNFRAFNYGI